MCLPIKTYPLSDVIPLGTLTATQLKTWKKPFGTKILSAYIQGGANFSADNSNYVAVGAINKGVAGAGTTTIIDVTDAANTTKATGGTAITAFTPNALTVITASGANKVIANETVQFNVDITGTVSIVDACLIVNYLDPRRA